LILLVGLFLVAVDKLITKQILFLKYLYLEIMLKNALQQKRFTMESSKNKFPIYLERIIVWHVET